MKEHTISRKWLAVTGAVAVGLLVLGGCAGELRAERNGKQAGKAICDVKTSGNANEAQRNLNQAQRKMRDLQRTVGRPIDEDVRDINENLSDLVEHVSQGNKALAQQDIAVIERNIHAVSKGLTGKARAAYDGMEEGLAECD
jgi:peptidoglycan hydrolase CwlO-like protein